MLGAAGLNAAGVRRRPVRSTLAVSVDRIATMSGPLCPRALAAELLFATWRGGLIS